jgi:hypothetical protein
VGKWLGPSSQYLQEHNISLAFNMTGEQAVGGLFFPNKTMFAPIEVNFIRFAPFQTSPRLFSFRAVFYYSQVPGLPEGQLSPVQGRYAQLAFEAGVWHYQESFSFEYTDTGSIAATMIQPDAFPFCPTSISAQGPIISAVLQDPAPPSEDCPSIGK